MVNSATINAVQRVFTRLFTTELESITPSPVMSRLVRNLPAGLARSGKVDLAWILNYVRMRRWTGPRQVTPEDIFTYLVNTHEYESTIQVKIRDIDDGTYAIKGGSEVADMAQAYTDKKEDEFIALLLDGFSADGPDGVPFFSASHPFGEITTVKGAEGREVYKFVQTGTWSNTGTAALDYDSFIAARKAMRYHRNHLGRPTRVEPNLLIVGPENEEVAESLVSRPQRIITVGAGDSVVVQNELQNKMEVYVEPLFGDSTAWFLADTKRNQKPLLFVDDVPLRFQRTGGLTNEGEISERTFMNNDVLFGAYAAFGVAFGVPMLMYGSTGAA